MSGVAITEAVHHTTVDAGDIDLSVVRPDRAFGEAEVAGQFTARRRIDEVDRESRHCRPATAFQRRPISSSEAPSADVGLLAEPNRGAGAGCTTSSTTSNKPRC